MQRVVLRLLFELKWTYGCICTPSGWVEDRHSVQKALLAAANKDLKIRSNATLFSDSDSEEENEAQQTAAAIRQSFGNDFLHPVKVS